jgi:hypothetical protein
MMNKLQLILLLALFSALSLNAQENDWLKAYRAQLEYGYYSDISIENAVENSNRHTLEVLKLTPHISLSSEEVRSAVFAALGHDNKALSLSEKELLHAAITTGKLPKGCVIHNYTQIIIPKFNSPKDEWTINLQHTVLKCGLDKIHGEESKWKRFFQIDIRKFYIKTEG